MSENYGADWLRSHGRTVGELGARVADLLNDVFEGIYHISNEVLRAKWDDEVFVQVNLYGELSTYDHDKLTRLVVGAHDRALRLSLRGVGPGYMQLLAHPRTRDGEPRWHSYHPTIGEAIYRLRLRDALRDEVTP